MDNIDLKHLLVFDEVYRTASISRAAENLDMGQSAVSMVLAKFRKHYNDPLFVRTADGMQPTPLADDIVSPLRQATAALRSTLLHRATFDPSSSQRMFGLCMTDIGQRVMMPRLLEHLQKVAPGVRLDLRYTSDRTACQLESGEIDLAIGFLTQLDAAIYQQQLFTDRFVCIVNKDHGRLHGTAISLDEFERESHLIVATQGTGHVIVDETIARNNIKRKVGLRIPNFLGVISNIVCTDYVAIVPERFARIVADTNPIKILELPFKVPSYRVMQHWHERYARDPAIIWLRDTLGTLFRE
ncbi:LysR family transcriptional regulator [Burkholderia gladioli pv. gladioli]|uniref:Bacterial regulatory helix-turn-helix, lysR family protein n=1 Tax=Burkholderia gladioli TaxID=28095 RepID=A0A095F246_BURGA|nr:LysR family transcriptional regulator [Burkholderia gladioli]AJW98883.1 bacterial regulatory helix-turn-helix, lysR family protein [Burkholderia gladioli]ASD79969.1 LysR family transcriptional regulator [Burkholderia gladioli pv. gladioli]AWY54785.1 LysR family transcriptional regulator [Burkholderia gladioli pv. gladioli]KGC11751.1 bacterial regulatory helix-turn-helix, lysR family protein [Burkholderia gladioli]MDJ1164227.1 LysR family transcriptional regulator [Burkholderia gladioli pv. 